MKVDGFLALLENVSETSTGWRASCPTAFHARGDRSRGLQIGAGHDGRILIRCYAGCRYDEVCAALDVKTSDLFPENECRDPKPLRPNYKQVLDVVCEDCYAVAIGLNDLLEGKEVPTSDIERLRDSAHRLAGVTSL